MRQFLTLSEFNQMMADGVLVQGITYCVEDTGYEYELSPNNKVELTGLWSGRFDLFRGSKDRII
jgi:hypothetical protein